MLKNVDRSTGSSKQLTGKGQWMMDGLQKLKGPILLTEIMLTQRSYWQTFTSFFRLVFDMRLINLHLSLSLSLPISFSSWDSFGGPHSGWLHNHRSIAWVKILSREFLVLVLNCRIHHLCHKQSESLAPVRLAHKRKLKICSCLLPNHNPWTIYQTQDPEISYTWFPPNCWTGTCMCALVRKCCC